MGINVPPVAELNPLRLASHALGARQRAFARRRSSAQTEPIPSPCPTPLWRCWGTSPQTSSHRKCMLFGRRESRSTPVRLSQVTAGPAPVLRDRIQYRKLATALDAASTMCRDDPALSRH